MQTVQTYRTARQLHMIAPNGAEIVIQKDYTNRVSKPGKGMWLQGACGLPSIGDMRRLFWRLAKEQEA
jgi:hypothetical protein